MSEGGRSIREAPCDVLSRRALARVEMICEYSGGQSSAREGDEGKDRVRCNVCMRWGRDGRGGRSGTEYLSHRKVPGP